MGVWWNEATRKQATDLTVSGHIKWLWSPWLWLTVLSALVMSTLTAYVYKFVYPAHFVMFTDQSGWGGFVDYVGVALGPVFSLGALAGVLYSIYLQREQIQHLEKQPSLEELQRILAGISKTIDDILNKPMTVQNEFGLIGDGQSTVLWLLDFACAVAKRLKINTDAGRQDIESQKYIVTVKEFLEMESEIIVRELRQIVWCLGEHQRAGGSEVVQQYYRHRLHTVVMCLAEIRILDRNKSRPDRLILNCFTTTSVAAARV